MDQLNNILDHYYGHLIFTRVRLTNEAAVYAARIETLLGKDERFVMAIVPVHLAFKDHARLQELHWLSLQTRSLDTTYGINKQLQMAVSIPEIKLKVKNRNEEKTVYYSPYPVDVELLHNSKKRSSYQFNDNITLGYALGTWNCLINKL